MSQQQQEHRLGELLIDMGFLQQKELEDAVSMAQQTRLPLGSVLVMSGHLSDKELRAVVLGQSLLKDNVIVKDDMFKVMKIVRERGVSFEEGMQMLEGRVEISQKETNKLGELLIESERITKEQLQTALDTVESSGLPLGRVLVLTNAVTENVLKVGLEVQIGVRDGSVTRDEAIAKLRNATSQSSVTRQSIEMTAPTLDKILRLGEFFEKAGIISDTDMLNALEVALSQQRRVGEVLVQFNLVSERMVEAALELQHLTRGRQIRPDQAISALQNMHFNGMTLHQALGVPEPEASFIRPETLYMPLPNSGTPLMAPAPSTPQAVQPPAPAPPPPPPPPSQPAAPQAPAPAPAPAATDPNAVLLSGWGDESPAEEVREGWGDQAEAAPAEPAQVGWPEQPEQAPAQAPQAVPAPPAAQPVQMAAPPTFAPPDQAAAAAQPMQQFVTASGEFTSVPMAAPGQAYDPAQAGQPGFQATGALVPPAPAGYSPLPTQPAAQGATPAQTQVDIPAQQPPAAPATPAPQQTQIDMPAQQPPAHPEPPVAPAATPAQTQVDIPAQQPPAAPAPEPVAAPAAEAAQPESPAQPALEAAPPAASPLAEAGPTMRRQDAVDGVIAEIAFEAAQFAAAQETAAVSAGGLGIEAVGLAQLLKVTGIVTQVEMDRAIKDVIRDSVLLHDILKSSGVGDPMTLRAAYDAHIMVIGGQLTFEHAMIALDYCKRQKLSLYESFKQLGWLQE
jgi:hypothetical protein